MSIWRLCLVALLGLASGSLAAQDYRVSVLIDSNGQASGGCTVTTAAGSASGLEARLTATVSGSPAQVVTLTRELCAGSAFDAPLVVGGDYPVGRNNGINGADVVELAINEGGLPLPLARDWRITVVTEPVGGGAGDSSATFSAAGLGGAGIPLTPQMIPTLSPAALALSAVLFALALFWMARRHRGLLSVLLLAGSLSLIGVAWAANYLLDGEVGDWDVPPLGSDAAGELPDAPELDIVAVFGARESDRVFFRVDLVDVENLAPQIADQEFSVDENASAGSVIGTLVASDPNTGDTLSFAISAGNTAGAFALDAASGTLSVANPAALDFETTPGFALSVQVSDSGALPRSTSATVNIALNDVNEAPTVADQAFAIDESAANGTVIGSVVASDPDAGDSQTFAITGGNTGGAFSIDAGTGAITVASSAAVALANSPFSLSVSVTDAGGLSDSAVVTVTVNDLNDAPAFDLDPYAFSVAEDAAPGTAVGSVAASDPDVGNLLSYSIVAGNAGGAFAIDAASGAISVAAALDFETTPDYSLTVRVDDNGTPQLSDTATVNISVSDVNEAPLISNQGFAVDENATNGSAVGTVLASDTDSAAPNSQFSFAITAGNSNGAFAIDAASGAISVANAAELDREVRADFALTVEVTDGGTPALSASATVTVSLNDLNDNAPVADDAALAIDENLANGAVVTTLVASDADATAPNNALSYAITGGSGATAFAIDAASGAISVVDSAQLDRETAASFDLTVQVTDGGTPALNDSATLTISINDLNDSAPVANDAGFAIAENSANGSLVGSFTATDADATAPNNTVSYAISGGSGATAFSIDAASGAISVSDSAQLDAEASASLLLNLTVTDGGTPALSDTAVVTISLTDVNEAPVVDDQSFTVDENAANGTAVGSVSASDPDAAAPNNTLAYAITGGTGVGVFLLDAGTGAISVANSAALDFGTAQSFTLEISVTDGGTPALADTATLTIDLNDLNEAPSVADQSFSINENSANASVVGTVVATDPDATAPNNTLRYAVTGGSGATAFALDAGSGQISVADSAQLNFEVTPSFTLNVSVTDQDGAGLGDSAVITIDLNDIAEPPTAVDDGPFALLAGETFTLPDGTGDLLDNDDLGEPAATLVSFGIADATASPAGTGIAFAGATLTANANGSLSLTGPSQPGNFTALYRLQNADGFSDGSISFEIRQPPTAVADGLQVNVTATLNASLFADNGAGADTIGVPAATVLSIGGGDLGGDATSFATPASQALAGGTLTVGSDGALSLAAPTNAGSYSFSYRLGNVLGVSDALVTINVLAQANDDVYEVTPQLTLTIGDGVQSGRVLGNDALGSAVITGFGPIGSCNAVVPNGSNAATTGGGGRVVLSLDGSFGYIPPPGLVGNGAAGSPEDAFCYTITGGDTATVGFEFANTELVWFVDGDYAGANGTANGTQGRPFTDTAAADAVDTAGDSVFIAHDADPYTCSSSGWSLLAGTRLIGEAYAGTPSTIFGITPVAGSALPSGGGSAPMLSGSGVTCITLAASGNNQLRGLSIGDTGLAGTAIAGTGFGTLTIDQITLGGSGRALSLTNGSLSGSFLDLDVSSGNNEGIRLDAVGGSWSVAANAQIGDVAGTAVSVQNAPAGSSLGFSGGLSINKPSAGTGLLLNANAGSASFGALNIATGAGTAIDATSSPLSASSGNIAATGGAAISASGVNFGSSTFTSVSSLNSTGAGISLANITGSLVMGGGSVTGNAAGSPAFLVSGSAGSGISYAGSLSKSNNGRLVEISGAGSGNVTLTGALSCTGCGGGTSAALLVSNRTGGTLAFSNASKVFSTGTVGAILASSNTGASIEFSGGGLDIDTTSGTGLNATGGGTLAVRGDGNTITATSGVGLNLSGVGIATTQGGTETGLRFRSIASGAGGNVGISLLNTGSVGGLTVTGTGSAGSGGSISGKTGADMSVTSGIGIYLQNTANVALSSMQLSSFQNFAILGSEVAGFALEDSTISGSNGTSAGAGEGSIRFTQLTGAASIVNTSISGGLSDNFRLVNTSGTLNRLLFDTVTIGANSTLDGNDGIGIEAAGTAVVNVTVQDSSFTAARGDLFQMSVPGTGSGDLVFTGNTLSNDHPAIATGGGGVTLGSGSSSQFTLQVDDNSFRDAVGIALLVVKDIGTGSMVGSISNNVIGVSGLSNSGSLEGDGIKIQHAGGGGTLTMGVLGNLVRQYNNQGIHLQAGAGLAQSGNFNVTVTGNTLAEPGTNPNIGNIFQGLHLNNGVTPGDTFQTCVDIGPNTLTNSGRNGGTDFRLRQRQSTTVRLPGYAGSTTDTAAVVAFVQSELGVAATGSAAFEVPPGGGFIGTGSSCP